MSDQQQQVVVEEEENSEKEVDDEDKNTNTKKDQPFEWLTSPASLLSILLSLHPPQDDDLTVHDDADADADADANADADPYQHHQQQPQRLMTTTTTTITKKKNNNSSSSKRAIHIGSGSSTLGEYLITELEYDLVLDVDKDETTLIRMKKQWEESCRHRHTHLPSDYVNRLQHVIVDFTKNPIPNTQDLSFGLILDKGTLDCTLCSETNGTASLLMEVYRCLAIEGGVYMVISFHEIDFIVPLLRDLPGAQWTVTYQQIKRQVEELPDHQSSILHPPSHHHHRNDDNDNEIDDKANNNDPLHTNLSSPPSPEENHPPSPLLTVVLARKYGAPSSSSSSSPYPSSSLNLEDICNHIHRINDEWFQESRPLLTEERQEEIQRKFLHQQDSVLSLPDAYHALFTDSEREDFTYDLFLEDWSAYVSEWRRRKNHHQPGETENNSNHNHNNDDIDEESMTYEIAVDFLRVMQ